MSVRSSKSICRQRKLLYSRKEAAAMLGISLRMIDQAIVAGTLPVKRVGRRVLLSQAGLDAFIAAPEPNQASRGRRQQSRIAQNGGGQ
jgi:excisionase family DNA binding protein